MTVDAAIKIFWLIAGPLIIIYFTDRWFWRIARDIRRKQLDIDEQLRELRAEIGRHSAERKPPRPIAFKD